MKKWKNNEMKMKEKMKEIINEKQNQWNNNNSIKISKHEKQ